MGERASPDDTAPQVLLADDQVDVLKALRLLFKSAGYAVTTVSSPAAALDAVEAKEWDLLLIDLNYTRDTTSGREGLDLLSRVHAANGSLPVVVMTAWGNVELAVDAMRRGARDFVEKPWDNERLLAIARTQVELARALQAGRRLEEQLRQLAGAGQPVMLAESRAMLPVLDLIARVSRTDANILIAGENGTGKGLVARTLHFHSARSNKPLMTLDAASLSETVFESELFGHVRGAFTDARADRIGRIEMADGGTLFLDEIANVPLKLQGKLLRVLETGEFEPVGSSRTRRGDVRLIAATNADLHAEVQAGRFRQDLLFRLNTIEVHLPPLRDRREDIPLLASSFLERHARRYQKQLTGFSAAAMGTLLQHSWPGNVRELEHCVERAVLMAAGVRIEAADLGLFRKPAAAALEDLPLEEVERVLVRKAMDRYGGNVRQAASVLGLSRTAMYRRLQKHGLLTRSEAE